MAVDLNSRVLVLAGSAAGDSIFSFAAPPNSPLTSHPHASFQVEFTLSLFNGRNSYATAITGQVIEN
jgi:hypothetical protein